MNILITGASNGIGYHTAIQLSAAGHHVWALARNAEKLNLLAQQNSRITPVPFDLSDLSAIDGLAQQLTKTAGKLDVLINNAGFLGKENFTDASLNLAQQIFAVNFFAPAQLIRSLVPLLAQSKNAHIVNISSMGGFQGSSKFPGLAYYSASKAALAALSECLAVELFEQSIRVNSLALGAVQTEMLNDAFPGYQAPVSAVQMAAYIADFAINAHTFINGKTIPVALTTP